MPAFRVYINSTGCMLLQSSQVPPEGAEELLIINLIGQGRYAEAYMLLKTETPQRPAGMFNLAVCFYWLGSYRETLVCLDKARMLMPIDQGGIRLNSDNFYKAIREKQNLADEYKLPITSKYIALFGGLAKDNITRLKTDCWLQLEVYQKVIEVATPIAHKNYKNIDDALQIAKERI